MLDVLLAQHARAGVLLDTNLLVMYLIGSFRRELVPKFKRTSMYTIEDYDWLNGYVSLFDKVVVTPHVIAETWNFVEKLASHEFEQFVCSAIEQLTVFEEIYIDKESIVTANGFHYVGITDMSVIQAAQSLGCLVITDDLRAYSYFCAYEVSTININHLRRI